MRVADYIAEYIFQQGVKDIFMLSGGGMMFLSDGIAIHPELNIFCTHHEQAAAMAAVSYAKYRQGLGICYVTTGCGGTNAITGLLNGWQDNTPCVFISGQCKRKETIQNSGLKLRQFGVQEADIISIVDSITKYSVMVNDPDEIAYHLDKAFYLAVSGRPGPVWIDIPMDVSSAVIDKKKLRRFDAQEVKPGYEDESSGDDIENFKKMIRHAERPIVLAGQGIRLSKSIPLFKKYIDKHRLPVVVSRLGFDLLPTEHPQYIGCIGNKGTRAGNFAVQNADLVIVLGSRLSVSTTGHEYDTFAREAKIIVVDIDPVEHSKNTIKIDLFINSDAGKFLGKAIDIPFFSREDWLEKCQDWKEKYPVWLPEYADDKNGINLYYFMEKLSKNLKSDSVVVGDAGSAVYVPPQSLKLKDDQRYITSGGQAEMGYTVPACIGISIARQKGEVIGITGEGSFQLNLQEMQTIVHYDLPVKIFVWNNEGYLSIRTTQSKFFEGRLIGADKTSGVSFPSLGKIAGAYGIQYFTVSKGNELDETISKVMKYPKAVICEVICKPDQEIVPTVSAFKRDDGTLVSKPLEDMYPFLDRDEFRKEMIVKVLDE